MSSIFRQIFLIAATALSAHADTAPYRRMAPLAEYVRIGPVVGGGSERSAVTLDKPDMDRLVVRFLRDNLEAEDGIQFVRITTIITRPDGTLHDKIIERAFTFARVGSPEDDDLQMREYALAVRPLSFSSRRKIDSVDIALENLPDWARVEVRVDPDEEFAAYSHHLGNRVAWHYRARGGRIGGALYLGIPKVLYDFHERDDLDYGRTSVLYLLFLLDRETGERFPVNVGLGSYGVRTPIDVSSEGGGFVVSALLDVFEVARRLGMEITTRVHAGIEVVPFFPLDRPARVLVALRVGIAP